MVLLSTFGFKNKSLNFTPVSNIFIENYMPKARGEYVKVYLLGLKYCVSGEPGVNSSIMASTLHLLETDVINAWNYWNDENVVIFNSMDNKGNFSIEFLDLKDISSPVENREINLLKELENNSTKDMFKEIEKLYARPLSSKEIQMYLSWQKDFNFSPEILLLLVQYCVSKGKRDSRYAEKIAFSWHDASITTVDGAQTFIKKHEDKWININKILAYLGIKDGEVMRPQEDLLTKWLNSFNFSLDIIYKACDICFERLSKADFKYIDAILTNWAKKGYKTIEEIDINDRKKSSNSDYKNKFTQKKAPSSFNDYEQREYNFDELERKMFGWDKK